MTATNGAAQCRPQVKSAGNSQSMNRDGQWESRGIGTTREMSETWRAVVGFEGAYEVSDRGNVRSLDRMIANPYPGRQTRYRISKGRTLKPGIAKGGGYPYVNLTDPKSGRRKSYHVHRIVLWTFVGPMPTGMVTRHINGIPADNRLENLAYGTPKENAADMIEHGTSRRFQTNCKRGHELSGDNMRVLASGSRLCKACQRQRYHENKSTTRKQVSA
jgi:hypothetical protein